MTLQGDAEYLKDIENAIKEANFAKDAIAHKSWQIIETTIDKYMQEIIQEMSKPDKLEWKSGVLYGLNLLKSWAKRIVPHLTQLHIEREKMIVQGNKE